MQSAIAGERLNATTSRTPKITAAIAALFAALRQVGGLLMRASRALCLVGVAFLRGRLWAAFSIVPAAVPRCLRLRRVCAISGGIVVRSRSGAARDRSF